MLCERGSYMSFHVQLFIDDVQEKAKIEEWLQQPEFRHFYIKVGNSISLNDIIFIEVKNLVDWIKVRRIKKHYKDIMIFPLLDQSIVHTSPLAIELGVSALFTKPIQRKAFFRACKNIASVIDDKVESTHLPDESFREIFWRKVLKAEVNSEKYIAQAFSFISSTMVPNVVCVMQGFVNLSNDEQNKGLEASSIVQNELMKAIHAIGHEGYFIPFHKHAALMLKIPSEIASPSSWKEGEQALLHATNILKEKYHIHLYMGVGSIAREILQLKKSYQHAKIARKSVAKHQLSLRYFDEIPTNISVQKSVDYIQTHFSENIAMNEVATTINFSPTYFSRLFKKETGHSFVSYLTLVRILHSILLLRQTDQTIEQISMDLGFNTPNYFSSTFKKEIGLSPSQYRATKEILFSHNWCEDDF